MFTPCAPSASAAQKMTMIQVPASGTLSSRHTRAVFCVLHIIPARMFCQMQSMTCDVDCSSQVPSYHFPPLSTSMPRFFGTLSALFITTQWHGVRPNMIKCTGSAQLQAVRQPFRPRQVCASVPLSIKTAHPENPLVTICVSCQIRQLDSGVRYGRGQRLSCRRHRHTLESASAFGSEAVCCEPCRSSTA